MKYSITYTILASVFILTACSRAGGNQRGHEYMPDMVHTIGYEANLYDYYYYNRWGSEEEYKAFSMPRKSVPGTVARGEISLANAPDVLSRVAAMNNFEGLAEGSMAVPPNGSVPYYYGNTDAERLRATHEITNNPFPITEKGLANGKLLFEIYCGICHGDKANGQGYLVREEDPAKGIVAGVYPAAPANFLLDTFVNASPGRFYHAIMWGRNVMGSYADKLSYTERWEVIHYIRSLEAKSKNKEYSPALNTLNKEAIPWDVLQAGMTKEMVGIIKDSVSHNALQQDHPADKEKNKNVH